MVEGLVRVARLHELDGPLNLGNPGEFSMLELAVLVKELTGAASQLEFQPLPQDDPKQRKPDISRARELIQFEPAVALRDGLGRTIENFGERLTSSLG
jgi:UDP-glucuronate decarboxylase